MPVRHCAANQPPWLCESGDGVRVLFAAGGTAGHIEPALTLADALQARRPALHIEFIGGERGLETTLVPERGYPLHSVPAVAFPRSLTPKAVAFPMQVWRATQAATKIVRGTAVVVGFGGYPAVPAYLAARKLNTPLVIHEANAKAGLANRMAARWASETFVSYPGALPKAEVCPLPLRPALAHLDRGALRADAQERFGVHGPTVLVFGGSQGAQHLNAVVAESLPALLAQGFAVIHAFGAKNVPPAQQPNYRPVPYLTDMAQAYAAADLVVCRAGAMTCTEVSAVGIPAIFVPLATGNGEQRWNAAPIVATGGAVMVADADLTANRMTRLIGDLLGDPPRLASMSDALGRIGSRSGTERLTESVLRIVDHRGGGND